VVEASGKRSSWPILAEDDDDWKTAYTPGRAVRYTVVDMGDELPWTIVAVDVEQG